MDSGVSSTEYLQNLKFLSTVIRTTDKSSSSVAFRSILFSFIVLLLMVEEFLSFSTRNHVRDEEVLLLILRAIVTTDPKSTKKAYFLNLSSTVT